MINYQQKRYWKVLIFLFAVLISLASLLYTQLLIQDLSRDQLKMVELLADTYEQLNDLQEQGNVEDISFLFGIIMSNKNIPLILTDSSQSQILDNINMDTVKVNKPGYLEKQLSIMKEQHDPIAINYSSGKKNYIFYKNSRLITQLRIYPFIQLFFVVLFILIAYYAFNSSRKYEQNKVWTGMSRETAHQLGTPVSSLLALSESIKENKGIIPKGMIDEFDKDIHRLEIITERFSKIGTLPKPVWNNIYIEIAHALEYLKPRVSKQIEINISDKANKDTSAYIIPVLFDWVIENLCKNAINAMEGKGKLDINIQNAGRIVLIDLKDTGKGIPRSKFKTIFKAGYTTSKSGWGLGLSLSKRIIEMYHHGEIFVKSSEPGVGTTIRIKLINPQTVKRSLIG